MIRIQWFLIVLIIAEFFYVTIASLVDNGVQAPLFLQEPVSELVFSNESGSQISCSAHGTPTPTVTWVQKDGSPIASVLGLRYNFLKLLKIGKWVSKATRHSLPHYRFLYISVVCLPVCIAL